MHPIAGLTFPRSLRLLLCAALAGGFCAPAEVPASPPSSGERHTRSFPSPTAVRDIYRSLGQVWGLYIVFDPDLPRREIAIDLTEVTAEEAFARVTRAAGHFYQLEAGRWVLIAEDTPGKRRRYETQVLRMFRVEHTSARDLGSLLDQLFAFEATVVPAGDDRMILVRGGAARVEAAAALVRAIDRPRAEIELDVELLLLEGGQLAAVSEFFRRTRESARFPSRLAADELTRLRGAARSLAAPSLAMLDRGSARWHLLEDLVVTAGHGVATVEAGLALTARPWVHADGAVTLEVAAAWTDVGQRLSEASDRGLHPAPPRKLPRRGPIDPSASPERPAAAASLVRSSPKRPTAAAPEEPARDSESPSEARARARERLRQRLRSLPPGLQEPSEARAGRQGGSPVHADQERIDRRVSTLAGEWRIRLQPGETLLMSGILPSAGRRGLLARALVEDPVKSEMVLALTPRITRGQGLPQSDFEIICAAAEGMTDLCGSAAEEEP